MDSKDTIDLDAEKKYDRFEYMRVVVLQLILANICLMAKVDGKVYREYEFDYIYSILKWKRRDGKEVSSFKYDEFIKSVISNVNKLYLTTPRIPKKAKV